MYDPSQIEVPASFDRPPDPGELEHTKAIRALLKTEEGDVADPVPASDNELRKTKAHYWGKISLVDKMVGRILKKLEETHQTEDTIVVFTSDHGDMMGDHRMIYKSVMYEEATKVSMLIKIHSLAKPSPVHQAVSDIDLVPTLLDLLGQPIPVHLQGQSWAPYITTAKPIPERDVMIEWNGRAKPINSDEHTDILRTIRTSDGWKMTLAAGGEGALYHLPQDPKEERNLFYKDRSLERIHKLVAEINLWQKSTGDAVMLFDEEGWKERKKHFVLVSTK